MATYDESAATPMAMAPTHDNQIVAMFDTYAEARSARDKLAAEGIAPSAMDILDRNAEATDSSFTYEHNSDGFWGALKNFFMPEEDSHAYAEGLDRGHAMLVVRPQAAQREHVITLLETFDPIDFDARASEWKQGGWTGAYAGAAANAAPVVIPTAMPTSTATTLAAGSVGTAGDKIEVLEESLRVGKREVASGGIRVRSYVVERPVEEQVTLREERVTLERHAVDRPAGAIGADAFRERTINVSATSEEAVIAKDVRVVEEIGLRKDATERTETVKDTVRHTEVEIVDEAPRLGTTTTTSSDLPLTSKPI